jgi:nucleotide-binding universal stress UspA family protein
VRPGLLVPLDGSDHARAALPVARALAGILGADLQLVHVGSAAEGPRGLLARLGVAHGRRPVAAAHGVASGAGAVAGPLEPAGAVVRTLPGTPGPAILAEAARTGASAVVMCTHAGHPRPGRGLGSVAQAVIEGARCPVVLVPPRRGERPWRLGRVLLPQDGTAAAATAVAPAAELATRAGASMVALYVASEHAAGRTSTPAYVDQAHHEWPAWADEFLAQVCSGCGWPVPMRLTVHTGDPGARVLTASGDADLVVMAWHGRMDGDRARTLRTLLEATRCPVMLVRAEP